ncbi:hypothetical protein KBTX_01285 [wastewater metagenome]|uniref:Uncharacterized protein n=2 Tax=unclassified sequences TaxID=12908 RepID=A0A5B8RE06_9ZZZZ|nr:YraN family protein [Arhodomonas aquaeolei]MCS4504716.1 YraN family protein [Arhodomonas aquaeolei]QEA04967.1 hypothetical protein KBTEX_01285 [uncultured organism]
MRPRRPTRERGADAEALARRHLERQGLRFRAANVHCRGGELDLVMDDNGTLTFVEVRQRSRDDFGTAAESITAGKRRRLVTAARYYLHSNGADDAPCRFDAVTVDGDGRIEWLRDAFRADE